MSTARPDSGMGCSRLAFMRLAGIGQPHSDPSLTDRLLWQGHPLGASPFGRGFRNPDGAGRGTLAGQNGPACLREA
jgi:hypothetical protein